MRRLRLLVAGVVLALAALVGLSLLAAWLEQRIEARIVAEAAELGATARVARVRLSPWATLQLDGLEAERKALWRVRVVDVSARLRLRGRPGLGPQLGSRGWGPFAEVRVGRATLALPAGVELRLQPTVWTWDLRSTVELVEPVHGLGVRLEGGRGELQASQLDVERLAQIELQQATLQPGPLDGELRWERRAPRDVEAHWRLQAIGADFAGEARLAHATGEGRLELELDRLRFARLFEALGFAPPFPADELGSLRAEVSVAGRLRDPASLVVRQRLAFTPPPRLPPSVLRLRDGFEHEVPGRNGAPRAIVVSPASPDFVALADVPPLFVKALLLAEDSAFFSHPGIDLRELPAALSANWAEGGPVRGASTISQQLAKNLFLGREKSLERKLRELVIAFLLEAALGKERILEIYLNVIEWGPDPYGLGPATAHYFGKPVSELSPKEIAFLVVMIPGPVHYQRSFVEGALSAGLEPLVTSLLAKLRDAGALSEEEYQAALAETLAFRRPDGDEAAPR